MEKYLIIPQLKHIEESLQLAEQFGVGFEYNDFFYPGILQEKEVGERLIKEYQSYGLPALSTLHGAFFDVTVFSEDSDISEISKERVWQSMRYGQELGVKGVVFHTNYNPMLTSTVYLDHWLDASAEFYTLVAEKFPEMNIYIENMFDYEPHELLRLAKRMEGVSNFGVCLDYAHAFISKASTREWCESLSSYIRHVHINDNDGQHDLHLAVGSGTIDWTEFCTLRKLYFPEATILVETASLENQRASLLYLQRLQKV